jgi:hypothetical protein
MKYSIGRLTQDPFVMGNPTMLEGCPEINRGK